MSSKRIVTVNELARLKGLTITPTAAAGAAVAAAPPPARKSHLKEHKEYIANLNYKRNRYVQCVDYSNLPAEILYIIFSKLNFDDLITCTQVCKRWREIANNNVLWSKWVKKYKCFAEYENDIKTELNEAAKTPPSYKNICLNVMRKHSEKTLLKYKQLLLTKLNNFTRQIDLKTLLGDANIVSFEVIFYDKAMKPIYSSSNYKLVPFDMCASICWSNFDELASTSEIAKQIESVRVYAKVSLFLQITNGKVLKPFSTVSNSKSNTITKRSLVYEYKFNLRKLETEELCMFSNSMIKLYLCDKTLITALWNAEQTVKDIAFMTFNLVYTNDLVNRIFSFDYDTEQTKLKTAQKKSNVRDLELDSKFGLHDYFVYFCFRNQTNSVFLTHHVDIYKATRFEYCKSLEKKCLVLDVVDCDNEHDVGTQFKSLPKFFWNTEAFKKNLIDLLSIIDICIQDCNKRTMISTSFPTFVKPQTESSSNNYESTFIAADKYFIEFVNKSQFYLNAQINCLKDEFTFSSNSESYHLASMKVWLPLEFINEWFGTKFN